MSWRRSFFLVLCVTALPLFADREVRAARAGACVTSMDAAQDASGRVAIHWTASLDTDNLGFNVYRQTAAGREKINQQLIAGAAFFTKTHDVRPGRGYRWSDETREPAQYYVEEIDLHGNRTLHGPLTPIPLFALPPGSGDTDVIADLGTNGGVFVSPRGIGAPAYPSTQTTKKQREQQWDLAAQPAMKLMVTEEGWYRVTRSQLVDAGVDPGDWKRVAIFTNGIEQPVVINNDAIEFYGIGIDTPAAGARAYWLVKDKGDKLRLRSDKAKKGAPSLTSTPLTVSRIERSVFFTWLINNGERENFFGKIITSSGATNDLAVEHADTNGTASLEVVIQGGTAGAHSISFEMNGHMAGTLQLADQERSTASLSFPSSWLTAGTNTLRMTSLLGALDISVVESVRMTYPHLLLADNNALKVTVAGGTTVTVGGFTTANVRALDITDPLQPAGIGVEMSAGSATLVAPSTGTRTLLLAGDTRALTPAELVANNPSSWNDRKNAADLVIISAGILAASAEPLKAYRESQGTDTDIVLVQDLYDEFGFGERGPEAIREFLLRSRDWKRAPRFVILLGDASFDPRNYLGLGAYDLVPTKLLATTLMKTASDDWFSDFDNTDLPQLALGRLPARTPTQAFTMIDRIINRNTSGNTRVSFITDTSDPFLQPIFDASEQGLASIVSPDLQTTFDHAPVAADWESLLLTYIGHGSNEYWAAGGFTGAAASQLTNGAKKPVFASMTCLNGFFHDLYAGSMTEALMLNPNGGAVAVWASTSLTEPQPQSDMFHEFFRQIFSGVTLGEAAVRAKAATSDQDVRRSWILFGDPTMKLR